MYSVNRSTTKTSNKKKILYLGLGIIFIAIIVIGALELTGTTNFINDNESSMNEDNKFNQPPTEQEVQAGNEVPIKQDGAADETNNDQSHSNDNPDSDGSSPQPVALVISDIGEYDNNVEVSAFTPDVIASGTCTVEFKNGTNTITKSNLARPDASSTICIDKPFPVSELSASDEWEVTVTYESDSGKYKGVQKTILML